MILLASGCSLLAIWDREPPERAQEHARIQLEDQLAARWEPAQVSLLLGAPLPLEPTLEALDARSTFVLVELTTPNREQAEARIASIGADLAQLGVQGATVAARYRPAIYRLDEGRPVACAMLIGQVSAGSVLPPTESCSAPLVTGVQALIDDPRIQAHLHLEDAANLPLTVSAPFDLRADVEHAAAAGAFVQWRQTDGQLVLNGTDNSTSGLKLQFSIPAEGIRGTADIGGSGKLHRSYAVRTLHLIEE